jgi:hypothetical protein
MLNRRPGDCVEAEEYRILEKQNHLMINARIRKKLDSSATDFAFKDSKDRASSGTFEKKQLQICNSTP